MSCSHATGCPLFPLLRESLRGWRDYYCDSDDQWLGCARYQMSLTGERVPISLLPNGAHARHFEDAAADTGRSRPAGPGQAPRQAPPPRHDPWASGDAFGARPAAARPPAPPGHRIPAPDSVTPWAASAPRPVTHDRPSSPPGVSRPHAHPTRHGRQARGSRRGWWARFTDWMRGAA